MLFGLGLALNVHLKTTCIISRSFTRLDELVVALARLNSVNELETKGLNRWQLDDVNKIVRHLQIFTEHTGTKMTYKVNKIELITPRQFKFPVKGKDGKEKMVSNFDYFQEKYQKNLKNLPMVEVTKKNTRLPLELAFLVDKQFLSNTKIDPDEMVKRATHSPVCYFNRANEIVRRIASSDTTTQRSFGIEAFTLDPISITAR